MAVAAMLVEIARGLPADCRLDRNVDVPGRKPVPGSGGAIDVDLQRRLAERSEYREIGEAGDRGHGLLDLRRRAGQPLTIVAEQLDRVLALHPRDRLFDVVLDILREVELDSGKFVWRLLRAVVGQPVLIQ